MEGQWTNACVYRSQSINLLQEVCKKELLLVAIPTIDSIELYDLSSETTNTALWTKLRKLKALHDAKNNTNGMPFKYIAWSNGDNENKSYMLAISTTQRLEIWNISREQDNVEARVITIINDIKHILGVSWHPHQQALIVLTCDSLLLAYLQDNQQFHFKNLVTSAGIRWNISAWSPCGSKLIVTSGTKLHTFLWEEMDLHVEPSYNVIDIQEVFNKRYPTSGKVGDISAIIIKSYSLCIVTTDTPFQIYANSSAHPNNANLLTEIRIGRSSFSSTPQIISNPPNKSCSDLLNIVKPQDNIITHIHGQPKSSAIIDLTSIQAASDSTPSFLKILDSNNEKSKHHVQEYAYAHVLNINEPCAETLSAPWMLSNSTALPQISKPNQVVKYASCIAIGSSLSDSVLHTELKYIDNQHKLEIQHHKKIPINMVCRGLRYIRKPESFELQIAISPKSQRNAFFETQQYQLLPVHLHHVILSPTISNQNTYSTNSSSEIKLIEMKEKSNHETMELLQTLIKSISDLQCIMHTRFEKIDRNLENLTNRVDKLYDQLK